MESIKNTFSNERTGKITADKALSLSLTGEVYLEQKKNNDIDKNIKGPYQVKLDGPVKTIVDILTGKEKPERYPQPTSFCGELRPYQLEGYNWLLTMTRMGFNVCLADDMGLGKTIQIISYILQRKQMSEKSKSQLNASLIVCPTSVLGNWNREIQKFAPPLTVGLYYGDERPKDLNEILKFVQEFDVVLTSYGLLRKDLELLKLVNWNVVILDESQNIKNYKAQQTQAAYSLKSNYKIC
jgi:SNF2 family DNA or RNA helicase